MKKLLSIFGLLAILAVLTACSSSDKEVATGKEEGTELKTINIGYQKGNTLHILKESGILDEAAKEKDLTIKWELFTHGNTLMEGIYAGAIHFGHAADWPGIFAQASNKPFYYVGHLFVHIIRKIITIFVKVIKGLLYPFYIFFYKKMANIFRKRA